MLLDAAVQLFVSEPNKIFEAGGYEFADVGDVKLDFGSGGRIGERVGDVGENAGVAQIARGLFEIVLDHRSAHLQSRGGGDGGLREALAADHLDGDQLTGGGGHLRQRLLGCLADALDGQGLKKKYEQESGECRGHELCVGTNSWVDLCFTAMSMKARAARLSALSLRNTSARSRRTCASAMGMAASALARTSSSTLERAMNPMPTSAATKRFNSSLESSSIEMFGFRRRSRNSSSMPSRVCPALGTMSGNLVTSATLADLILPRG